MKLADFVLRLLLSRRNRETVSGDLLEEYREHVLPAKGRFGAGIWYWRQVLSFVSPLAMGLSFGAVLGVANLIDTAIEPLADDSAGRMLFLVAAVVAIWTVMAFVAARQTHSVWQAIAAGALVGAATLVVFGAANTIRVNVFLDEIQHREDWRHLMARFRESDATSLRAFVNRDTVRGLLVAVGLGAAAGSVAGLVAGAINALFPTSIARRSA